jgi:TPR repeat protein
MKKSIHYYQLAAIGGNASARYNLGIHEEDAGDISRAVKHWMISAAAGHDNSLKEIRQFFLEGHATKDDFEKALRAHKDVTDEMKSDQREAAAAARGQN